MEDPSCHAGDISYFEHLKTIDQALALSSSGNQHVPDIAGHDTTYLTDSLIKLIFLIIFPYVKLLINVALSLQRLKPEPMEVGLLL